VIEKDGAARCAGGPLQKTTTGSSRSTSEIATSTSRKHRPRRRFSDEQLNAAIQSLRDEQRHRREDSRLYRSEVDSYRRKGAHGRTFQLDVMRRNTRSWP